MSMGVDYLGPALTGKWKLQDFYDTGGTIVWQEESEARACATITHPETSSVTIERTWPIDKLPSDGFIGGQLKAEVIRDGLRKVFDPIMFAHWKNFTISHAGIPNDDPVFDKYKDGRIIY